MPELPAPVVTPTSQLVVLAPSFSASRVRPQPSLVDAALYHNASRRFSWGRAGLLVGPTTTNSGVTGKVAGALTAMNNPLLPAPVTGPAGSGGSSSSNSADASTGAAVKFYQLPAIPTIGGVSCNATLTSEVRR